MVLGISNDFTSNVILDSQLTGLPTSGLYLNSGVHPSITVKNLLSFLPLLDVIFADWDETKQYEKYQRNIKDVVSYNGKIYQSLVSNTNKQPDENTDEWLETNIESLRLKSFIQSVQDRVYSDLHLQKRLINNQYIYEVGQYEKLLPNNYCGWIFEPKGSDYCTIRLNQISIQKTGTTPLNLYVINQGNLVDTLEITPSNGRVDFKDLNYSFKGFGTWIFAIESTEVFTSNGCLDPLSYDGFTCGTVIGTGTTPETATYSYSNTGNGLGFNVSVTLDSSVYINNNIQDFGSFIRATFELMAIECFLHNSNNRSNSEEINQSANQQLLIAETKQLDMNTIAKKYQETKSKAMKVINKTFDTQLFESDDLEIETTSV